VRTEACAGLARIPCAGVFVVTVCVDATWIDAGVLCFVTYLISLAGDRRSRDAVRPALAIIDAFLIAVAVEPVVTIRGPRTEVGLDEAFSTVALVVKTDVALGVLGALFVD
jgi:hypothetical protein